MSGLPEYIQVDQDKINNNITMINQWNKHCIHAGSVFDRLNANTTVPCSVITPATGNLDVFVFKPVSVNLICKALKGIDNKDIR